MVNFFNVYVYFLVILKESINMTVFERIKFLSQKQGKSLNQVEEELGLSKNVLYRMKNSDNPTKERLLVLANYFGVSVDYLLGRTDSPTPVISDTNPTNEKIKILARKMDHLDDSQLDTIDGLIDNFFDKKFKKDNDKI